MATIQIRDVPSDAYEALRERARMAGQSLQAYMRDRVVEMARLQTRRAEMFAEFDAILAADRGTGVRTEDVLADLDEIRRR
jgi:plasmid stability protein